jgi:N-acetyl-anhydromuramyl-L-alanine amidase AmpD
MSEILIRRDLYRLPEKQFVNEPAAKNLIVLHGTGGTTASGAFEAWRKSPERVATAYIIDRDGAIHEVFPPECWAWHLGAGDPDLEKRSIGIELVNAGPLTRAGDELRMWTGRRYCAAADRSLAAHEPFRGFQFFATYTPEQASAAVLLANVLCDRFDIPRRMLPDALRETFCLPVVRNFSGIVSHHNVRRDKWDPATGFVRSFLDRWQQIARAPQSPPVEGSVHEGRVL